MMAASDLFHMSGLAASWRMGAASPAGAPPPCDYEQNNTEEGDLRRETPMNSSEPAPLKLLIRGYWRCNRSESVPLC